MKVSQQRRQSTVTQDSLYTGPLYTGCTVEDRYAKFHLEVQEVHHSLMLPCHYSLSLRWDMKNCRCKVPYEYGSLLVASKKDPDFHTLFPFLPCLSQCEVTDKGQLVLQTMACTQYYNVRL